jgi:site-specific DNA-methyltransferase (adenine-specific)/site-specific DNA-methyltransferase (cytosine-N4-specific)
LAWAERTRASVKQLREEKQRRSIAAAPKSVEASGTKGEATWEFKVGDCRSLPYPDDHFDLVFCSPPYEAQRGYGELEFNLVGEDWVAWAVDCYLECLRVSKGLVAWVVEGYTDDFAYSSTPFLLMADLHRRGVKMRKTVVYQRNGIPGTGGPEWLRNDWEPIICATKRGRLPWADNIAMGQPPKQNTPRVATNRNKDGSRKQAVYVDPEVCNPGNIIGGLVGSGGMGWRDATKNEAPFPEWLAEFFVRSFCPPGGTVLDPFSGSGTTVAVAVKNGRNGVGVDARESQVWLGETRLLGMTVSEREQGQGVLV